MACPCDDKRTVIDFMAQRKVKAKHPVISKLLGALAELDKMTAVDESEQQQINQIRHKIETVASFANARLPAIEKEIKDGE
jgi:hypothetical protein